MFDAFVYPLVYYILILFLVCYESLRLTATKRELSYKGNTKSAIIYVSLALALFIGSRPITSRYFGDTINYAYMYSLGPFPERSVFDFKSEWLWYLILNTCKNLGFSVNIWFIIIAVGYFLLTAIACKRLSKKNSWLLYLFFLSAFSTFSYSVNGLRNGLACSIVILGISFIIDKKSSRQLLGLVIFFIAVSIHRSVYLPIICCLVSRYLVNDIRFGILFWVLSIPISLLFTDVISGFFSSLGFDDRLDMYLSTEMDEELFSHTGFRWDFLLYSIAPIILAGYISLKNILHDRTYNLLANTYILANAFWIMIIKANYSNRFAYLSWFLYPIVIAYPLVKSKVFKKNNQGIAMILFGHCFFTIIMWLIGN